MWVGNSDLMVPMKVPSTEQKPNAWIPSFEEKKAPRFGANVKGPILAMDEVQMPKVIKRVSPQYPAAAQTMGLTGQVVNQIIIDKNGRVADARVSSSNNPIFNEPCLDAVKQWKFSSPTTKEGKKVNMYYFLTFRFEF